jgi:hypothetical protein
LSIFPFYTIQSQKLISPISVWEKERQTRRLNIISFGIYFTPTHHNWKWIQVRINYPIYQWTSNGSFPDGSIPVPSFSLSITKNGLLKSTF